MYLMTMKHFLILLTVAVCRATKIENRVGPHYECTFCQPEQIHISFGDNTNDIVVTWSTFNDTQESVVEYGKESMDQRATGSNVLFTDGGPLRRQQYIHTVTLNNLTFNSRYVYHAGSEFGWSERFSFKTPPEGQDWVVRAAIYGDMGNTNAHSMSYLQNEAERDNFDVILHVGDFAYDMDTENALVGDQFMRQIQPLAAIVPYMTCPGNHEEAYNFSNYANRFTMPGEESNVFYSFDLGPVHFISISTEVYYYLRYGDWQIRNQYNWLVQDLTVANTRENRAKHPWIVIFGHRPMYCNNLYDLQGCTHGLTRRGLLGECALEPLLKQFGVDVAIWAHEHSYERSLPLYDNQVYNGSVEQPYVNPNAPVHILTGSAGCRENTNVFRPDPAPWSAFRSSDYGYTRFKAYNKTHIYMEQVDVDLQGKVIDSFWLVKDKHEAYVYDNKS